MLQPLASFFFQQPEDVCKKQGLSGEFTHIYLGF